MKKHFVIPTLDGLYWYFENGKPPAPVLINQARYGSRMKAFNGSEQAWLRDGEYLIGPVEPPTRDAAPACSTEAPQRSPIET